MTTIGRYSESWIAREVAHNRFTIRTRRPHVKVSWQVTGVRQDRYANANRIEPEVTKPANEPSLPRLPAFSRR